jgi:uncharacterized protein (UPF0332 family)
MRFEECIDKGLIKKDLFSRRNLEINEYEMAEIAAYNSAFHAGRALLFAKRVYRA